MKEDIRIRLAEKKDINRIIELCKAHAEYEKSAYDIAGKAESLEGYLFEPNPGLHCLVVEKENEVLGYSTFMKQFSTWDSHYYIYLDCLYLEPEIRGFGIGEKMMEEVKAYAESENCKAIQWQTPDFNHRAIKFYKRIGATAKTKERFTWDL